MVSAIDAPPAGRDGRIARELAALALMAVAAFTLLSLLSFELGRRPNLGGAIGALFAENLTWWFGYQAYIAALLIALFGHRVWVAAGARALVREAAGGLILIVALSTAASFLTIDAPAGGLTGSAIAQVLLKYLNLGGGYLVVLLALIGGLALMLRRAPTDLVAALADAARMGNRAGNADENGAGDANAADGGTIILPDGAAAGAGVTATALATASANGIRAAGEPPLVRRAEIPKPPARDKAERSQPRVRGAYKLPSLSLLDTPPLEHAHVDEAALERSARMLEQKLADFGVQGHVVEVQPGPVVTMYKLEPGSGVKVSQIVNLADDLSMALRAATIRILAPVPGEAVVGIEVPNRKREKVYLRENIESEAFGAAQSQLTIALGKDITGRPVAADLATMPHLLIAGATGTGKSVSIHTMIASILFNATADDVRFILIDPKMLELSVYEGIPHLLVPVVVDPEKAAAALLWATQEMEARYRMMRDLGVRNIDGYNRALNSNGGLVELKSVNLVAEGLNNGDDQPVPAPIKHRKLPKIVIIIDELADLLLSEGKTVERDITRLAQKARASGIHLILATQRPSVDVITGLIKANLPARISLQVTSRVDSRTILDSIGAERLLGAGDMLFMPPGTAKLRRLHGPFVSETEIRRVCDFLRAQGAPDYQMEILETAAPGEGEAGADGDRDQLYDDAVRIVLESGQASISMIQRRLRIGYNRSARMVEQMEREGIVLPADGARPREVRLRGA
ncbi:MAG: DNA translocase FtsK 4TM domain-containing protein [Candidatus Binataceae bacterium]